MFVALQQHRSLSDSQYEGEILWGVDSLPLNHGGLASLQFVLTRGNSAFSPSLHTELITAHNHTENVASVIKTSGRASSKPLFQFNTAPQKGRSGLCGSQTLFVKYKYTVLRSDAHVQRRRRRASRGNVRFKFKCQFKNKTAPWDPLCSCLYSITVCTISTDYIQHNAALLFFCIFVTRIFFYCFSQSFMFP